MSFKQRKPHPYTILGYEIKKGLFEGYRVIEYTQYKNEDRPRKRTLYKSLSMTDAENIVYNLERKHKINT